MDPIAFYVAIAVAGSLGIFALLAFDRPSRLFGRRAVRLPRTFDVLPIAEEHIPEDARRPLDQLVSRLGPVGFRRAGPPARIAALQTFGYRILVIPFVHVDERTYFLLGIEGGLRQRSHLMLHIITPLSDGRRVETTTIEPLAALIRPERVDPQVVVDAESVAEIWSRHRLALNRYERNTRASVAPEGWSEMAATAYEDWIQSAVRSQRLQLESNGEMYRVRRRPKSVV